MNPVEPYLTELREIRAYNAHVEETSFYGTLETLLNEIGKALKPKVRCIINTRNVGAGVPDGGLFTQVATKAKLGDLRPTLTSSVVPV